MAQQPRLGRIVFLLWEDPPSGEVVGYASTTRLHHDYIQEPVLVDYLCSSGGVRNVRIGAVALTRDSIAAALGCRSSRVDDGYRGHEVLLRRRPWSLDPRTGVRRPQRSTQAHYGRKMGGNWEKSRWDNRIELRSSASNGAVATCRFDVFAGQIMIPIHPGGQGVAGSNPVVPTAERAR